MKKKIYSILMLGLVIGLNSCKKEDKVEATVTTNLTIDATAYTLAKGAYLDYGNINLFGNTATHYSNEFYTTDGTFTISALNELDDVKGKIALYCDLYSAGIGTFKSTTYTYVSDANDASLTATQLKTKYENKNVMLDGFVVTGTVANASLINAIPVDVKSGSVTIEGTKPNFKIIYDLVLVDNKIIKGTYTGSFALIKD